MNESDIKREGKGRECVVDGSCCFIIAPQHELRLVQSSLVSSRLVSSRLV